MLLFLLLFGGTLLISLWAQWHVKSTYQEYSQIGAASGATGAEVAAAILQRAGIDNVEIEEINATLGDHYDPINHRLALSSETYHGQSLAALGIAAHECGHAIQHKIAYAPLHLRMAAVGAVNFVNPLVGLMPFLMIFHLMPYRSVFLLMAICTGVIMLFNLITLPVEFDASNRAKEILAGMGYVGTPEEISGVKKTLDAAGWTYVAAFVVSLITFLYYLLPLLTGGSSRRD